MKENDLQQVSRLRSAYVSKHAEVCVCLVNAKLRPSSMTRIDVVCGLGKSRLRPLLFGQRQNPMTTHIMKWAHGSVERHAENSI